MTIILRPSLAAWLLALLLTPTAAGPRAQPTPPTTTLDFIATGDDGRPIPPLSPSEIAIKVGGRERTVRSLEIVTTGGGEGPAIAPPGSGLPAPFGITQAHASGATGRTILLLVDDGTLFGFERILRDGVAKLIGSLGPRDRLGLVSTQPGGVNLSPTTRHDTIQAAVDAIVPGRGNAVICIGPLLDQVHRLAQVLPPGRASTLALISRGAAGGNPGARSGIAANCAFRREELRPVEEQVAAAQINYFAVDVGGSGPTLALDNFGGATGAERATMTWTDASGLARAIGGRTHFYRATIDADPPGRAGTVRVELRVNRPNVKVRTSSQISTAAAAGTPATAAALLRGSLSRADLPLRVAAFASRNEGAPSSKLTVVLEPVQAGAKLVEAMVSVTGADGEVAGQWTARRGDLARAPMIAAVPVAPGAYRVRVAAVDESGRGGTAEYDASAVLAGSDVVKMSAIVLGVVEGAGFAPRLVFGSEPAATAYLEIYDAPASATVSVAFELATSLDAAPLTTVAGQVARARMGHMVTATIPLTALPAGDTLVRARVTVDGVEAGQVVRTLRKQVNR